MTRDEASVQTRGSERSETGTPKAARRRKIRLHLPAKIGVAIVGFWVLSALFAPLIAPYDPAEWVADDSFLPISVEFILGSDTNGRDVLSRLLYGTRWTLLLSLCATLIAFGVGVPLGYLAAVGGGVIDQCLSRTIDAFMSLPGIILALVVISALGTSEVVLVGTVGLILSLVVYRFARALAMDIKVMDFIEAARVRGEGLWWIIRREILPNAWIPLLVDFGLRFIYVVLLISALSFLGLGVQPPEADWGMLVRENLWGIYAAAPAALAPATAIASLTIGINLIVDDISAQLGSKHVEEMV